MWLKFRSPRITKDEKKLRSGDKSLNVQEEYLSALRTQSYADFFSKAQSLVNEEAFPSCCHHKFSEILLEPGQETIHSILESANILSEIPGLKSLMLNYFDLSVEASRICSLQLKSIHQLQFNYKQIHRVLDIIDDYSSDKLKSIVPELNSFVARSNPFSTPDNNEFNSIHDRYLSMLHRLKQKRKMVARKVKVIKYIHHASGFCITAACGLLAATAVVLAAHTLVALVMGPAILSFPLKGFKTKLLSLKILMKSRFLRKIGRQLDVAAKGTYILYRDFDTMSRLVARLHDEVEHNKAIIKFCLERKEDKFPLQVVKELKKNDVGFRKQVEELEEHVYLCLVTINRARALVIKEMTTSTIEDLR